MVILPRADIDNLLKKISRDDEAAFEALFFHYFKWLTSVSISITGKKEIAEEIVQDVFLKLWEKRRQIEEITNIETYLFVAIKNRSLNYLKSTKKEVMMDLDAQTPSLQYGLTPESTLLNQELELKLDQAIAGLPEKCRHIFQLIRMQGHSYKAAAEILGISAKTVENQLSIALKKIRGVLDEYNTTSITVRSKL